MPLAKALVRDPALRLLAMLVAVAASSTASVQLAGDTFFNLVLGREMVRHGLITHNDLTLEGAGAPCVDQQWLTHLLFYWLELLVGLPGMALVGAAISGAALLAAAALARAQGATPGRTLLVGILSIGAMTPQVFRAQTLALPLLVVFLWLLSRDAQQPARRSWWLVPCAVLWGNLHGSALLAPVLGGLLAGGRVLDAARTRRWPDRRLLVRDTGLSACLAAALLVSPYGLELLGYYGSTFANPAFRVYLREWHPLAIGSDPVTALLVAACLGFGCFGLRTQRVFPIAACFLFAIATLTSARHSTQLAIASAALLPASVDAGLRELLRFELDQKLHDLSRLLMPVALIAGLVLVPLLTARSLRLDSPVEFTDRVAAAAASAGQILADEYQADRLLWFHPELKGRLSHDVRMEVLSVPFMERLTNIYALPQAPSSREQLASYDLVIVDRLAHPRLWEALRRDAAWEELGSDSAAAAFARRKTAAPARAEPAPSHADPSHAPTDPPARVPSRT